MFWCNTEIHRLIDKPQSKFFMFKINLSINESDYGKIFQVRQDVLTWPLQFELAVVFTYLDWYCTFQVVAFHNLFLFVMVHYVINTGSEDGSKAIDKFNYSVVNQTQLQHLYSLTLLWFHLKSPNFVIYKKKIMTDYCTTSYAWNK